MVRERVNGYVKWVRGVPTRVASYTRSMPKRAREKWVGMTPNQRKGAVAAAILVPIAAYGARKYYRKRRSQKK